MMATREPIKVFNVNFSFKNNAAKKPVKIGAVASIKADVVESAVCTFKKGPLVYKNTNNS